jgi:hypothetical protein
MVTKDKTQATKDASEAEDLARARGVDLATATGILIKAQEGNVGALKKLGIEVPSVTTAVDALKAAHIKATPEQLAAAKAADKQATAVAALAAIHKAAAGQASAYAGTMAGEEAVASTEVEGIQEKLGETINKMVQTVLPGAVKMLGAVADWFGKLLDAVQPLLPVISGLVDEGFSALQGVLDQVTPVLGELTDNGQELGPVLAVVGGIIAAVVVPPFIAWAAATLAATWPLIAIGAAVVGVIAVLHNLGLIQPIIHALTLAMGQVFNWFSKEVLPSVIAAVQFVASHVFPLVASAMEWVSKNVLPALGAAFGWIVKNVLPPIVAAIGFVANTVLPALGKAFAFITDRVIPAASNAVQTLGGVFGRIFGGVGAVVRGALNVVIGAINGIIRGIDAIRIPAVDVGPVHFGGWGGFNIPQLPFLHAGGMVPGPPGADVLAVLQAGERVVPRSAAGDRPIIININGGLIDGPTIDVLTNELTRRLRFAPGT